MRTIDWRITTHNGNRLPRVDLHRERQEKRRQVLNASRRDAFLLLAALLVTLSALAPLSLRLIGLTAGLVQTRRAVATLESGQRRAEEQGRAIDDRLALWTRFTQSREQRAAWNAALEGLADAIPPEVYLENIEMEEQNGELLLNLRGFAAGAPALQSFHRALTDTARFAQVAFKETALDTAPGPRRVRFTIQARAAAATSTAPAPTPR
jgi:Tfp pilus assembly protein PilN